MSMCCDMEASERRDTEELQAAETRLVRCSRLGKPRYEDVREDRIRRYRLDRLERKKDECQSRLSGIGLKEEDIVVDQAESGIIET